MSVEKINDFYFWKPRPRFSSVITKVCAFVFLTWPEPEFNCIHRCDCSDWSRDVSVFIWTFLPLITFSLRHRHQRAAVHPADRDEDEQEWTAEWTRERQRDPGLTPRPFPDPSTFDPTSTLPLSTSLSSSYRLLTAAQPADRRDRPNHPPAMDKNGRHIKLCLPPDLLFPSLPLFFSPFFSLRCCGSSP